ncbi:MAG: sugar phosphate isomerase/epimerase [Capsulimonadaceae bacterium]|nr:sugar phosphate isomerase/epimerase [Capsulimonadaceae bacterium]
MKLGYGTYGMKELDIIEVIPRLRDIGYEMIEISVAPAWTTAPAKLSAGRRASVRRELERTEMGQPVLLCLVSPCEMGDARNAMLSEFEDVCRLADDLNTGDGPAIVTSTLGGPQPPWDEGKETIASSLIDLADIAAKHGVVYAIEPHVGGSLDRPEKAEWLIRRAGHENLKLNFDYSHFHVQGIDLEYCIDKCMPYSVHTHIKDGSIIDGRVAFTLPGDGNLDLAAYFAALLRHGCALPACVEVSGMVWNAPGYDPWDAAQRCYKALDDARLAAAK